MCMELRHKSLSLLWLKHNTVNRVQDLKKKKSTEKRSVWTFVITVYISGSVIYTAVSV